MSETFTTYGIGPDTRADELQALRDERVRLRAALQAFCDEVEMDAAAMAYKCGLGAGEWEAFIDRTKLYKQYLAGKAALTPAGQRWTRSKPTEAGWYWWRHNACSPVHATYLERGNGCDRDGLWYAQENIYVPHNAAYVPYGEWQGPLTPNEATE